MELKSYFRILVKRWWIILGIFISTVLATAYWTYKQPLVYETVSTFILRPRSELIVNDEFVRALDIVSRRVEINTTFAEVARSQLIQNLAAERLQLSSDQMKGFHVSARVIGGTNIMELTVQGRDPYLVADFAGAVGIETVKYVSNLYDVFELEPLDEAEIPTKPVNSVFALNISLGVILGLALGLGVALLVHYIQAPRDIEMEYFNIIDRDTGAYNKSFFLLRLWQEMSRAKRNKYPLSLGLLKIEYRNLGNDLPATSNQAEALRRAKVLTEKILRDEDILARFENDTLALLLPDTTGEKARSVMESIMAEIGAIAYDVGGQDHKFYLKSSVGLASYQNYLLKQDQFLQQALQALASASLDRSGQVILFSSNHFQRAFKSNN